MRRAGATGERGRHDQSDHLGRHRRRRSRAPRAFWSGVLDGAIRTSGWSGVLDGAIRTSGWPLTAAGPAGVTVALGAEPVVELDFRRVAGSPPRARCVWLDINPVDRSQHVELDRLVALGACRLDRDSRTVSWYLLADPESNEFRPCRDRVLPLPQVSTR
ncbi:MAG TPA: VOC family protein [Kribbella sp.]|nr:VOC family protein [Kribbella sp.]